MEEGLLSTDKAGGAIRRGAAARRQAGLTDDRALNEARADLENARVQVLELQTAGSEALSRLAILLGEYPGQTDLELSPTLPELPETMVIGIPAAVLARRPDESIQAG